MENRANEDKNGYGMYTRVMKSSDTTAALYVHPITIKSHTLMKIVKTDALQETITVAHIYREDLNADLLKQCALECTYSA
jgi:hypothetical protein